MTSQKKISVYNCERWSCGWAANNVSLNNNIFQPGFSSIQQGTIENILREAESQADWEKRGENFGQSQISTNFDDCSVFL